MIVNSELQAQLLDEISTALELNQTAPPQAITASQLAKHANISRGYAGELLRKLVDDNVLQKAKIRGQFWYFK